jgi:hypothetical protein
MSDGKSWVTPSQAIKEMAGKLPQVDANALLYWARDGKIQIQCHEVTCSDDGGLSIYIADNIPSDFWQDAVTNGKPNWTVGELTVQMEVDEGSFEQWTASGLKIELGGLQQAINIEIGQTDKKPLRAAKGWHTRTPDTEQKQLFKFFGYAGKYLSGGAEEKSLTRLHEIYSDQFRHSRLKGRILKRTAFETWHGRHQEGWRISETNSWQEPD